MMSKFPRRPSCTHRVGPGVLVASKQRSDKYSRDRKNLLTHYLKMEMIKSYESKTKDEVEKDDEEEDSLIYLEEVKPHLV